MDTFEAGIAVRDITPAPGQQLWGYTDRAHPASDTLDPLYAKTIAFRAGDTTASWTVLDLGRVPLPEDCDAIRRRVSHLGLADSVFHATHTHHAPAVETMDDDSKAKLLEGIVNSIEDAVSSLEPARVGVGVCAIDIAHNRRRIEDGHCRMIWRNEGRHHTEPVDPEATLVRIDRASGKPLALLVHFACHPVVMGPSNEAYSADFVGALTRIAGGLTGAECFFFQGACGDINPYLDKTPVDEGGVDAAFTTGRVGAEAVAAAFPSISTRTPPNPAVAVMREKIDVGVRWNLTDKNERRLLEEAHPTLFSYYVEHLKPEHLAVPLTVLTLNRDLAFIGIPGEPFCRHQLDLKAHSPFCEALLCGYVNDYHGYFPPIEDAAAGGYGGTVGTYVGLGAAEKLMAQGRIAMYRMIGRFKDKHEPEDFAIYE